MYLAPELLNFAIGYRPSLVSPEIVEYVPGPGTFLAVLYSSKNVDMEDMDKIAEPWCTWIECPPTHTVGGGVLGVAPFIASRAGDPFVEIPGATDFHELGKLAIKEKF